MLAIVPGDDNTIANTSIDVILFCFQDIPILHELCYYEPITLYHFKSSVPGPVSGLSATPGVVQLTISWSPPSEPNGIITMYQVSYNISGVLNYTNTSATQHTLRDLPPNTVVTFSVRAYTIIGPGEAVSNSTSTTDIRECTIGIETHINMYNQ